MFDFVQLKGFINVLIKVKYVFYEKNISKHLPNLALIGVVVMV